MPWPVSMMSRLSPVPTIYVLVPCRVNCGPSAWDVCSARSCNNSYLSRILAQYAEDTRGNLLDVWNLGEARNLRLEIVLKGADIERLVDLAVAALVLLLGGLIFHLCTDEGNGQAAGLSVGCRVYAIYICGGIASRKTGIGLPVLFGIVESLGHGGLLTIGLRGSRQLSPAYCLNAEIHTLRAPAYPISRLATST